MQSVFVDIFTETVIHLNSYYYHRLGIVMLAGRYYAPELIPMHWADFTPLTKAS